MLQIAYKLLNCWFCLTKRSMHNDIKHKKELIYLLNEGQSLQNVHAQIILQLALVDACRIEQNTFTN